MRSGRELGHEQVVRTGARHAFSAYPSKVKGRGGDLQRVLRSPAMSPPAARVEHLSKIYRVHERPPGLVSAVRSVFRRAYKDLEAVRDLSFSVAPGERVGFLG